MVKPTLIIAASLLTFIAGCSEAMFKTGVDRGKLSQCPSTPNCVSSQAINKQHFIAPIRITATPLEAKNTLLKILGELKASNRIVVIEDNYIKAEFVSNLFRFIDDVEFYFPDTQSKELLIHVRSASRVGYSDLGVNRKRIEMIRREMTKIHQDS